MPRRVMKSKSDGSSLSYTPTDLEKDQTAYQISRCSEKDALDILTRAGVGTKYYTCYMCGKIKPRTEFYQSTDLRIKTHVTRICKECASDIAHGISDENPNRLPTTKELLMTALEYLDRPYIDELYDAVNIRCAENNSLDLFAVYMTELNKGKKYASMRWRDSDGVAATVVAMENNIPQSMLALSDDPQKLQEAKEEYDQNRKDVIHFAGYDPFIDAAENDKPRLYAQMVGFLDDDAKNDPFKMNSIIQIVKGLNDAEVLSSKITTLLNDSKNFLSNTAVVSKMMETRSKDLDTVQKLAKDNGISMLYNTSKSSASNTLSARIKKVTEENLREGKVNMFNIGTVKGMQQVAEISAQACMKEIGFNEDIANEVNMISRDLVTNAEKERDEYKEKYRLLLQENKDLKDYLRENNLINDDNVATPPSTDTGGDKS